jgi:hypothetical protein
VTATGSGHSQGTNRAARSLDNERAGCHRDLLTGGSHRARAQIQSARHLRVRSLHGTPPQALSQLAWAHSKAVEPAPASAPPLRSREAAYAKFACKKGPNHSATPSTRFQRKDRRRSAGSGSVRLEIGHRDASMAHAVSPKVATSSLSCVSGRMSGKDTCTGEEEKAQGKE